MLLVVKKQTATYPDESMRLDFSPANDEEEDIIFHNIYTYVTNTMCSVGLKCMVPCYASLLQFLSLLCHFYGRTRLHVCSRRGAIQIHVYLYLYLYMPMVPVSGESLT